MKIEPSKSHSNSVVKGVLFIDDDPIKTWLRVPRCLTDMGLYGDSVLKLPPTSLTVQVR